MRKRELKKRIKALEKRVAELENPPLDVWYPRYRPFEPLVTNPAPGWTPTWTTTCEVTP